VLRHRSPVTELAERAYSLLRARPSQSKGRRGTPPLPLPPSASLSSKNTTGTLQAINQAAISPTMKSLPIAALSAIGDASTAATNSTAVDSTTPTQTPSATAALPTTTYSTSASLHTHLGSQGPRFYLLGLELGLLVLCLRHLLGWPPTLFTSAALAGVIRYLFMRKHTTWATLLVCCFPIDILALVLAYHYNVAQETTSLELAWLLALSVAVNVLRLIRASQRRNKETGKDPQAETPEEPLTIPAKSLAEDCSARCSVPSPQELLIEQQRGQVSFTEDKEGGNEPFAPAAAKSMDFHQPQHKRSIGLSQDLTHHEIQVAAASPPVARTRKDSKLHGMRVLVVEDNLINQKIARLILDSHGCQVSIAENGRIGFEMAKERDENKRFDIILMDIQMPVMDGFESAMKIREHEMKSGLTRTPIVSLTASPTSEYRRKSSACGMDDWLAKPFSKGELLAIIIKQMSSKSEMTSQHDRCLARRSSSQPLLRTDSLKCYSDETSIGRSPALLHRRSQFQNCHQEVEGETCSFSTFSC